MNPVLPKDELEDARKELPALVYAQEYLAQFVVDNITQWLYAFDETKHVKKHLPFIVSHPVFLAWDFNREPLTCSAWQFSQKMGLPTALFMASGSSARICSYGNCACILKQCSPICAVRDGG